MKGGWGFSLSTYPVSTDEGRYQAEEGGQVAMEEAQDHEHRSDDHIGWCSRSGHVDHALHLGLLVHYHYIL